MTITLERPLSEIIRDFNVSAKGAFSGCKAHGESGIISHKKMSIKKNGLTREDYRPTDEELEMINSSALIQYEKKQLFVFTLQAFDTKLDRSWEHFLPAPAPVFSQAKTLFLNKTWLRDHTWKTDHEIGAIFDTWVEGEGLESKLMLKVYTIEDEENKAFLNRLFSAIHRGVSVGFLTMLEGYLCDSCNKKKIAEGSTDYQSFVSIFDKKECPHKPGTYDEDGDIVTVSIYSMADAFEISSVPIPAQRDSGTRSNKGIVEPSSVDTSNISEIKINTPESLTSSLAEADSMKSANEQEEDATALDLPDSDSTVETTRSCNKELQVDLPIDLKQTDTLTEELEKMETGLANSESAENEEIKSAVTITSETDITKEEPVTAEADMSEDKGCDKPEDESEMMGQSPNCNAGDGNASSSDLSEFEVRVLKALEPITLATTQFTEKLSELTGLISEHKNLLTEHLTAVKSKPATSQEEEKADSEVNVELLVQTTEKAAEQEKRFDELMNLTQALVEKQAKFLDNQLNRKEANKSSWAELFLNHVPQEGNS